MLAIGELGERTIEGLVDFRPPCGRFSAKPSHAAHDGGPSVTAG
jgi:hypothetical protein